MAPMREQKPESQASESKGRTASSGAGRTGARDGIRQSVRGLGYEDGARALSPQGGAGTPNAGQAESLPSAPEAGATQAPPAGGGDAGGLSPQAYEAALGRLLGGKLFEVVAKETSPEKMTALAGKVVDALVKATAGLADKDPSQDPAAREAVKKALEQTLGPALKAEAEAYLATEAGRSLEAKLQGYATAHPWQIVAAAVLAAAGAVAANVAIPRIGAETSVALGKGEDAAKLTVGAGAKLGKIRDIALEAIDARIALEAGRFSAEAKVERKQGGEVTGTLGAKYGDDDRQVSTNAVLDKQGVLSASVGGKVKTEHGEASLSVGTGRDTGGVADASVKWNDGEKKLGGAAHVGQDGKWSVQLSEEIRKGLWTDTQSIGASEKGVESSRQVKTGDDRNFFAAGMTSRPGDESAQVSGRRQIDEHLSIGAKAETGTAGGMVQGDAKWASQDLTATLNARFGRGKDAIGGSVDGQLSRTLSAGADVEFGLIDRKFLNVGVRFGYRDPDKFEAFLLEYRRSHAGDVPMDQFKATVEATLGDYMVRAQTDNTLKDGRFSAGVGSLQVARPLNQDWALIGGVSAGYGPDKTQGVRPEIGVQYKNIPVTVGYDINNKSFGVRLTIPFGR